MSYSNGILSSPSAEGQPGPPGLPGVPGVGYKLTLFQQREKQTNLNV